MGTHFFAALFLSETFMILVCIKNKRVAATMPPNTGEITQLAAIFDIVVQFTNPKPAAAIPAPNTPPTIE